MKLLMFCDPGIDDTMALIYALLNPNIELIGIVCSYGNVDKKTAAKNAAHILKLANKKDIPLINGAEMPVNGELATYYPEIHGADGIGPIQVNSPANIELHHLGEVFSLIEKHYKELVIVDLGRSTTLATCFLLNKAVMDLVQEFHLMGGAFLVPGNVTPVAEANFHGDPTATNLLLMHCRNVYLTPLNVTQKTILTSEFGEALAYYAQNQFKALFVPIIMYYAEAYSKLVPGMVGAPFHDLFTVYSILYPNKVHYLSKKVSVETLGKSRGKSLADFRHMENEKNSRHNIALGFDYDHFLQDVFQVLCKEPQ